MARRPVNLRLPRLAAGASILTALLVVAACGPEDPPSPPPAVPDADPAEAAVQRTVDLFYETSSFTNAATADPEAFRTAFAPSARLAFVGADGVVEWTVDEYVDIRRGMLAGGEVSALVERELGGSTEVYGTVAHRMSGYEVYLNGVEEPAERGVMSFQLLRTDGAWRIHSLTWQSASPELPVPARYEATGSR